MGTPAKNHVLTRFTLLTGSRSVISIWTVTFYVTDVRFHGTLHVQVPVFQVFSQEVDFHRSERGSSSNFGSSNETSLNRRHPKLLLYAGNTSSLCAAEFRFLCVNVEDTTSSQHFITASMRSWTVSWDVFGLTGGNTQISESRCAPSPLFWFLCSSVQREQTAIMQRLRVNMAEDAGPVKRSSGTGLSDGQSNTCKLTFLINDFISDTNVVFLLFSVRNYKMTEAGITFCFILYKNQRNINLMHQTELKLIYSFMSLILMIQFYLSGFISDKIG